MGYVGNSPALDETVSSSQIVDLTVATADIANDAVTLAKMAGGTDGNIISYDASGDPVAIATGSDGQVLTSTGAGSPPAFEAVPSFNADQAQTFNDSGADVDFRVEGSGKANALFVQGSDGFVGIGEGAPEHELHITGAVPAILFENSSSSDKKWRIDGQGNNLDFVEDGVGQHMSIKPTGAVTMPSQPAFLVRASNTQTLSSINTTYTVVFGTEVFDQNADFASNTFIAPIGGRYLFSFCLRLQPVDSDADYYKVIISTSNHDYSTFIDDPDYGQDNTYFLLQGTVLAPMDASDTAFLQIHQAGGNAVTDIIDGDVNSYFCGHLVC